MMMIKIIALSAILLSVLFTVAVREAKAEGREVPKVSPFPIGEENRGFAQYFSGRSWLAPLAADRRLNVPIFNVTFEPGCRNNWHVHTGGQVLIAAGGVGYYQERGKTARRLVPGDVVTPSASPKIYAKAPPPCFMPVINWRHFRQEGRPSGPGWNR